MKSILFKAEMVRAILGGQKTQTRRVIKPQPYLCPTWGLSWAPLGHAANKPVYCERNVLWNPISKAFFDHGKHYKVHSVVYVRETWIPYCDSRLGTCVKFKADGAIMKPTEWTNDQGAWCEAHEQDTKWRSPIHMPEWASRIHLEITDVRVQRVQDISQTDAMAEGTQGKHSFAVLWDSINSKLGFGWETNPYVFAYTFKVVK